MNVHFLICSSPTLTPAIAYRNTYILTKHLSVSERLVQTVWVLSALGTLAVITQTMSNRVCSRHISCPVLFWVFPTTCWTQWLHPEISPQEPPPYPAFFYNSKNVVCLKSYITNYRSTDALWIQEVLHFSGLSNDVRRPWPWLCVDLVCWL